LQTGARIAAEFTMKNRKKTPEIAILVGCVGRKLVMNQRVEEEVEQIRESIGEKTLWQDFMLMEKYCWSSSCDFIIRR
jgi:hypothetical protein